MDIQTDSRDSRPNRSAIAVSDIFSPTSLNSTLIYNISFLTRLFLFLISCLSLLYLLLSSDLDNFTKNNTDRNNNFNYNTSNFKISREYYIPPIFGLTYNGRYTLDDNGINVSQGKIFISIIYRKIQLVKLYRIFVTLKLEPDDDFKPNKYTYISLSGNGISNNPLRLPSILPLHSATPDLKSWYLGKGAMAGKSQIPRKGIDKSFNLSFLTALNYWDNLLVENNVPHVCGLSGYLNLNSTKPIKSQPSFQELDEAYITSQRFYNIWDLNYQMKMSSSIDSINIIKMFNRLNKSYMINRDQVDEWKDGWDGRIGSVWSHSHEQIVIEPIDADNNELSGRISSSCGFGLKFSASQISFKNFPSRTVKLFIMYIIRFLAEGAASYYQLSLLNTDSEASRISIISIFMITLLEVAEIFIILIHYSIISFAIFNILIALFTKFTIFTLIQMKMILLIYKSTHRINNPSWAVLQAGFAQMLKKYFCMVLILTSYFFLYYISNPLIILPLFCCWVPQILLNMWKGQRRSMNLIFVYTVGISKILLPLYIYGCPYNIFYMDPFSNLIKTPNKPYSFFVLTSMILQLYVITLQMLIDPRWISTCDFLPKIYNYERNWIGSTEIPIECVICMYDIHYRGRNWSITPCDHIFHTLCLRRWTRIRLECPNCRRSIPTIPL